MALTVPIFKNLTPAGNVRKEVVGHVGLVNWYE